MTEKAHSDTFLLGIKCDCFEFKEAKGSCMPYLQQKLNTLQQLMEHVKLFGLKLKNLLSMAICLPLQ